MEMEPIQLVDLRRQYARLKDEIDEAMARVLTSTAFIRGPDVDAFEAELAAYTGARHVVTCANGTDALQIALMALDLQPGDEVITPDFSYFATAEVIALLRLKPVFVDVDPRTFTIDPAKIEEALTAKTKAIIPVHLYGQCADMAPILKLASQRSVAVVEDAAQAIGALYTYPDGSQKQAGTMGTIGATSFFPSKNLGCYGDGGALFVNDESVAQRVRMVANHGQTKKYFHDIIGVNSRLDTIQAAILRVKLRHLDDFVAARRSVARHYDEALSLIRGIESPFRAPWSSHVFHQYTLQLPKGSRDRVATELKAAKVPTAIYYPKALHAQPAMLPFIAGAHEAPVSAALCERVLSLPMHTEMDDTQQTYVSDIVGAACHAVMG